MTSLLFSDTIILWTAAWRLGHFLARGVMPWLLMRCFLHIP